MVKVFSIFHLEFSVYFIKFEISNLIMGCCQSFPRFCDSGLHMNNQIPLVYEIGNFRDFSKIHRKINFKSFSYFAL